jgi:squalene monooxygenase
MPNSFLPPIEQGGLHTKEGVILLGDAWNMRHPLTGGGMTVAFSDIVLLAPMIADELDLTDWHALTEVLHRWHWARKPLAATINILSVALYDLFSAEGTYSVPSHSSHSLPQFLTTLTLVSYLRDVQTNTSPF